MRQGVFVGQNEKKWKEYEEVIKNLPLADTDLISKMYVHLTEDLAFSKAKFSNSQLTSYLQELTLKVHNHIYRNKPESSNRLLTFWTKELPIEIGSARKYILYAFLIMLAGVGVGLVSAAHDVEFARFILGDQYVEMTYENIENGDPMAVYKGMGETDMFFAITVNNIRVSFLAFTFGILASIGSGFILFQNGVMLGVFHWLFISKGIFDETILTIWIHGTLEISAIIVAGAAGMVMGNGLLFPGNYPRLYSLKRSARRGLKIVLSLVPFFIVAGFLEAVATRNTEWPLIGKLVIILTSLFTVIFYLFVLPNLNRYAKK